MYNSRNHSFIFAPNFMGSVYEYKQPARRSYKRKATATVPMGYIRRRKRRVFRARRRRQPFSTRSRAYRNLRIGGFLGIEKKFLDCAWNGVALTASTDGAGGELQPASGCTNAISIPAQGDGESQRDGRKYTLKSAYINGEIALTGLNDQPNGIQLPSIFLALVLDTQANGATVTSENVYINPGTSGETMLPKPFRNLQNTKRFRVLDSTTVECKDIYSTVDGANTASIQQGQRPKFELSWNGSLVCDSTGTTADVASASDNALHLIGYTDTTLSTPVVYGKSRIRFFG